MGSDAKIVFALDNRYLKIKQDKTMKNWQNTTLLVCSLALCACETTETLTEANTKNESAAITAVTVTGDAGSYNFSVTIESPDTGCEQYADWWEVLTNDGRLVYRRILSHSHVGEQPFTRSGGPVNITADQAIFVRAHMNSIGYGSQVFSGTVEQGLVKETLDSLFADELEIASPLPEACAF